MADHFLVALLVVAMAVHVTSTGWDPEVLFEEKIPAVPGIHVPTPSMFQSPIALEMIDENMVSIVNPRW